LLRLRCYCHRWIPQARVRSPLEYVDVDDDELRGIETDELRGY